MPLLLINMQKNLKIIRDMSRKCSKIHLNHLYNPKKDIFCFKNSFHSQFIIEERYSNIIKARKYRKIVMKVKLNNSNMIIHKYAPFESNVHEK